MIPIIVHGGVNMNPIKRYIIGIALDTYLRSQEPLPPHLRETSEPGLYGLFAGMIKSLLLPEKTYPQNDYIEASNHCLSREYRETREGKKMMEKIDDICLRGL